MQHTTAEAHEQTASGKKKQGTGRAGKAALRAELREESLDELDRLAEEGAELDEDDLEAMEFRYREAALKLARAGLARRLAKNRGYRGPRMDCGQGHEARFVAYRERTLKTAVGPIAWAPAYYDCADCPEGTPGLTPRDRELGISKDSMSPGLNRMVGRVSSKGPFAEGHEDLLELSGIDVPTKLIERHGEACGELISRVMEEEWDEIRAASSSVPGPVVALRAVHAFMYVAMDGTGVPTVAEENKGRKGKGEDGRARTREAKIGCVFTSTTEDERGNPIRDSESTTIVATMEPAARFGELIKGEALRRGWEQSEVNVVLGDGAEWIWNLADEHFPDAIQVVDLFHSKERLSELARLLFRGDEMEAWRKAALDELDAGEVGSLLDRLRAVDAIRLSKEKAEELGRAVHYFTVNRERMHYAEFRESGLFVGSGVVEAGCKSVVATRLKQSGMRWTIRGASSIIALRSARPRWREVWERAHRHRRDHPPGLQK